MRRTRRHAGGFTLIEIMVSLAVVIIGLLGIMALQTTTVKANRLSRNIERARIIAGQVMEDLRARPMPLVPPLPDYSVDTPPTPDGMTFHRDYAVTGVTGSTSLLLITATVTFTDPADQTTHSASVQLVRTNQGEVL